MCTRPKSPTDLHTLGHVDFSVEHVPEERRQKVLRVEQGDEDSRELVHLLWRHHVGQGHRDRKLPFVADHRHQLHEL